jgi:hypothetical protein
MEETEEKEQTFCEYLDNDIANRELRTNENSNGVLTIQQTQRNALRKEVADKFVEFLLDNGLDAFQTKDGIIIKVDNKYVGAVSIELKLAFKALGYDPEEQAELFDEERDNKARAAEEKAKAKTKKESK